MSVFSLPCRAAVVINTKITGSTVVTIVDGTNEVVLVPWFQVNETAGSTPNLTVDLYDVLNTTSYVLGDSSEASKSWNVTAVTAKQSVPFREGYIVPKGWLLRVKSSDAAGKFDVIGIKVAGY